METLDHRPHPGKPFPTAIESEKVILGMFLLRPGLFRLAKESALEPEHFFMPPHEGIYQAMLALDREGKAATPDAVFGRMSALQTAHRLDPFDGVAYLLTLSNQDECADGLADHIATVKRTCIERKIATRRDELSRPNLPRNKQRALGAELASLQTEHDAIMSAAEGWPDPLPLPDDLATTPKLTPDMLPPALRGWLSDMAERMQCPLDFPAVAGIVALASLIGRKLSIYPKRRDDWREVCNLWGLLIGPPGILKSPAMEAALEPLFRLEREARKQYELDHEHDELDSKVARAKSKGIEAKIAAASKDDPLADVEKLREELRKIDLKSPAMKRYVVHDSTIEALGPILRDNPRGVLQARDEVMGWLRTMDRDGHEGDRGFYLQCWTGRGEHSSDRVSRKQGLHGMCLSVVGGIQPGPLSKYIDAAAHGGMGDDGFVQRFQLSVCPNISEHFQMVDRWPDREARDRAYEVFRRGDVFEPSEIGAEQDSEIWFLRFADDAQERFLAWLTDLEHRLRRKGGLHPVMQAHLAKYRGLFPKLALLFHVVECVNQGTGGPVSLAAAEMALKWCRFLEGHAARLFGSVTNPGHLEARALAERILRGQVPARFSSRELYRHGWTGLKTAATAQLGIDQLVALNWLRRCVLSTGGRPSGEVQVNPKLKRYPANPTAKTDTSPPDASFSTETTR